MKIRESFVWVHYLGNNYPFDPRKTGKWMYFFDGVADAKRIAQLCETAVKEGLVEQAKHSNHIKGVACFYLNIDDTKTHQKILSFFLENNLIQKTKDGKLVNIGFKLDDQTRAGEYGERFKPRLTLDQFVDLHTGQWLASY